MNKVNWYKFNIKNLNIEKAFEDMCLHVFCRTLKVDVKAVTGNFNNKGLERHPVSVKDGNGEYIFYGFQSKHSSNGQIPYTDIEKSLNNAYDTYSDLHVIYIYTNADGKPVPTPDEIKKHKDTPRVKIFTKAKSKNIELKWITKTVFEDYLSSTEFDDITQYFFADSHEIAFLSSMENIIEKTLLLSNEFIELPIEGINNFYEYKQKLIDTKVSLLTGGAGSGKTSILKKIFYELENDFKKLYSPESASEIAYLPMFIRLRECINGNLEGLVRERLKDYRIDKTTSFEFIYFFDAIDEVSPEYIISVLDYAKNLRDDNQTKAIIFSSRNSSFNLAHMKRLFNDIYESKISGLNEGHLIKYFDVKNNSIKKLKLSSIKSDNNPLYTSVTDILMLSLLYQNIDEIDRHTTIVDFFELSANTILNNYSKIHSLNILQPKQLKILSILSDVAYHMAGSKKLTINIEDLQLIIRESVSNLSNIDINKIAEALSEMFFNFTDSDVLTFSFRHRRFQEYFLCKKLYDEFFDTPEILRQLQILSDKDFIMSVFLKYGLNQSVKKLDVLKNLALRFFEAYLGSDYWYRYKNADISNDKYLAGDYISRGISIGLTYDYGVGGMSFYEQPDFIYSITSHTKEELFELLERLNIFTNILQQGELFNSIINTFYRNNGIDIYDKMVQKYQLNDDNLEILNKNINSYEYLYLKEILKKEINLDDIYREYIKEFDFDDNTDYLHSPSKSWEHLYNFYRFILEYDLEYFETLIDNLPRKHLEVIAYILIQNNNIYTFHDNSFEKIREKLSCYLSKIINDELGLNAIVLYNLLTNNLICKQVMEERFDKVNKENLPTWQRNIELNQYIAILLSDVQPYTPNYILGVNIKNISLQKITKQKNQKGRNHQRCQK